MYKKVDTNLNFVNREKDIAAFWKENDIFRKSIKNREGHPTYMFYDGPPTANGKPHIGHVLTRVVKDTIPRYHTMKGEMVPRKAGWDTHGLPVEIEVEKLLGLDGKEQIEEYGVAPFIEKCKESVWKYEGMWREFSDKVGFWADMDQPYVTYDNNFIESEWWALKQIYDKDLLYQGYKVVPFCPRCGTPLSSHEVAQGYKEVKERSAVVRFKVIGEDAFFLAWTTTPWTLPSNVALCVNPNETYVKVSSRGEVFYMAEALLSTILGDGAEVLETYLGKDLEYKEYEPLFEVTGKVAAEKKKKAHYIVCDTYVTMTDGTGIVHIAPAFGEDDANVGRHYDLPLVQLVDEQGNMSGGTPWDGIFVKKADPMVLDYLKEKGLLFAAPEFTHDYPHCWRCGTPLLYYARESWFIKTTAIKDRLVENNKKINWIPASIGEGRFGAWLENVQDWALSRNRYWGTPLPIWVCDDCGEKTAIGSIEELKARSENCPDQIELHKPHIDQVELKCACCGGKMHRVPEVIDCWFDSGSMPFAQHHYPFENKDLFEAQFPASFISEAVDQTRGWFYSLHAISTLIFDKPCFENCIILGLVLDENGQKMSKSKGNSVDPMEALEAYGADAIRWYFTVNSAPWLPSRFYKEAVQEGQRKFLGTLWNTYAFYVLYANIDNFDTSKYTLDYDKLPVMDKWILSRLNSTIKEVDKNMTDYKVTEAGKALSAFVDELSNWYVRRCRDRFWAKGMEQDKINAYMTLNETLVTVAKLAAPIIPFMTEEIYQNLVKSVDAEAPESIHLCDYPVANEAMIDAELEANMDHVLDIVVLGRAARNDAAIKNRQPIGRMMVKAEFDIPEYYQQIITDELNVKAMEQIESTDAFMSYTFKPQLKTVGPKYGKLLGGIRQALATIDGSAAMNVLKANGVLTLDINGSEVKLLEEDLLIDTAQTDEFQTQSDKGITVVLDKNLTPELIEEGFVRELISKIQTMRKEAGFQVMDRINVYAAGNDKIKAIMEKNAESIRGDVLADAIIFDETDGYVKDWKINKEAVTMAVKVVSE
ncbi:MAG: isoleucine--tRNA ligase [Lachnospiraceae bacterium]|nr:isoleucine--tRNA ligase [Candidatus Equihabitans merdae]